MTFGEIFEGYSKLRLRLVSLVGQNALPEITVAPPKDMSTELGFLRFVGWSYAFLQENGRVAVKFLLKLGNRPLPQVVEDVSVLRTWAAHNLSLDKPSDEKKLRHAWAWFRRSCGASVPEEKHWDKCGTALCGAIGEVMRDCISAAEVLDDPVDGPRNVDELRRRLDREWEAYRFDAFINEAAARLGYRGIDPVVLRRTKLDAWRNVVRAAEPEQLEALLTKRIEGDVLELMGGALPLRASEFLERLTGASTYELAVVMLTLRRRAPPDEQAFGQILTELGQGLEAGSGVQESPPVRDE